MIQREILQRIYEQIKTPYKYGPVLKIDGKKDRFSRGF